jgi:nickel transport protein
MMAPFHLSTFIFPLRRYRKGAHTMRLFAATLVAMLIAAGAAPAFGHGVEGHIAPGRGYQVTAVYDDGEPMSYAAVEIKAAGEKIAFQTGRTDRNGSMLFLPDRPGVWEAVVSDGMGHRLALEVDVPETGGQAAPQATPEPPAALAARSRVPPLIAGLGIIFGLFGFLYGWKARRALGRTPPAA